MRYRELGNTGMKVSEIGMGCEGFTPQNCSRIFDEAEKAGINYFDLYRPDPEVRRAVSAALQGRREKFMIQAHLCAIWKNGQYLRSRDLKEVQSGFEDMMEQLKTDALDVGMIHYCDSLSDWKSVIDNGILDYACELKRQGRIRSIGLSGHNPEAALAAVSSGKIDVLMFSVNPCYDLQPAGEDVEQLWADKNYEKHLTNMDPERQDLYETCSRLGVGITVMKAFGGGDLLDASLSPAGVALSAVQCIHYALTRPGVATICAGARSVEELRKSLAYETASDAEKDYAPVFASFPNISWEGHCMYCSHCEPCPEHIDIASVTRFLNLARAQGRIPETVREHYMVLEHHGGECAGCGSCEKRCPFHVSIRKNMEEAARLFGY